jgi:uncharacterized small protein (DUF1192 family)
MKARTKQQLLIEIEELKKEIVYLRGEIAGLRAGLASTGSAPAASN